MKDFGKEKYKFKMINLFVIFFLIVAAIGTLSIMIFHDDVEEDVQIVVNPNDIEVDIYINNDNIIYDYSTFFTIEDILITIFAKLNSADYESVYYLLSEEYKSYLTLEEFSNIISEYLEINIYANDVHSVKATNGRLNYLYEIENNLMLCNADFIFDENDINLIIYLEDDKFEIYYLSILRGVTYE